MRISAEARVLTLLLLSLAGVAGAQGGTGHLADFAALKADQMKAQRVAAQARAGELGLPTRRVLADGTTLVLVRLAEERPVFLVTQNLDAADTVSTDEVWPGGSAGLALEGSGQELGLWDGGNVRESHQELAARVVNLDEAPLSTHSTRVAGMLLAAGVDPAARGMASAATIPRAHDLEDDVAEMAAEQLLVDPVRLSNHSYAFATGWWFDLFDDGLWVWLGDVQVSTEEDPFFGLYVDEAADWDRIVYDSPAYLPVVAAGNDRDDTGPGASLHWHFDSSIPPVGDFVQATDLHPPDGDGGTGFDSIAGGAGSAKNNLTIGAVHDIPGGYAQPSDVLMAVFSSWGPTDDGRIKPDLVANGVDVYSPAAWSDTAYSTSFGTSFSAPNVTGSIALLNQLAESLRGVRYRASTMKALVIHTADEAGPAPGPDFVHGWGLLNTLEAARVVSEARTIFELTLVDQQVIEIELPVDGSEAVAATICWTDPPGDALPATAVDPAAPALVNDLDLRLVSPTAEQLFPWVLDPANPAAAAATGDNMRDNVEQVKLDSPEPGVYTIRITHKGVLQGGAQDFSLVVTGRRALIFADGFESSDTTEWSVSVP